MFDARIALGLPSLAGYSLAEALSTARRLGFQSIMALPGGPHAEHSLGPFPTLGYYDLTPPQRRGLTEMLAGFKHIAIHQAWDTRWAQWIECAALVGARVVTIHAGRPDTGQTDAGFIAARAAMLRRIGDYAGERGVRIGVENEGGPCARYLGLVEAVDHPSVGATLDVGHCAYIPRVLAVEDPDGRAVALNETIHTMVEALGPRLFSVHVHDVQPGDWRDHHCVGSGIIDFPALFRALHRVHYTDLLEIELEEPDREAAATRTGAYLTTLCRTVLTDPS